LVYVIKGPHVRSVLVGGEWVVRDGKVVTMDVEEVLTKSRQIQERIRASLARAEK
jgi:predicted metalloprotease